MISARESGRCASFRSHTRWPCACATPGAAPKVVCEYVGVDQAALNGVYRLADAKLTALQTPVRELKKVE
jgi:hypothetical protein